MKPEYVYVASSWRNPMHPMVCAVLKAAKIPHYDFKNPEGNTGFSWAQVKAEDASPSIIVCQHCGMPIRYGVFDGVEPDYETSGATAWRHVDGGYAVCGNLSGKYAIPKKGSDWESAKDYLEMMRHPRALEGFTSDYAALQRADTVVMILPCGKSAHLELGWAAGAGKRTAILLEDPVEPELMYGMVDHLSMDMMDLLDWLGVED